MSSNFLDHYDNNKKNQDLSFIDLKIYFPINYLPKTF